MAAPTPPARYCPPTRPTTTPTSWACQKAEGGLIPCGVTPRREPCACRLLPLKTGKETSVPDFIRTAPSQASDPYHMSTVSPAIRVGPSKMHLLHEKSPTPFSRAPPQVDLDLIETLLQCILREGRFAHLPEVGQGAQTEPAAPAAPAPLARCPAAPAVRIIDSTIVSGTFKNRFKLQLVSLCPGRAAGMRNCVDS